MSLSSNDIIQVNVTATGGGNGDVRIQRAFTVSELGITVGKPTVKLTFDGAAYAALVAAGAQAKSEAERQQAAAAAQEMLGRLGQETAQALQGGSAVTPGQAIAKGLVDYLVANGLDGKQFSRQDEGSKLRISEAELTVSGGTEVPLATGTVRVYSVSAAAVWG